MFNLYTNENCFDYFLLGTAVKTVFVSVKIKHESNYPSCINISFFALQSKQFSLVYKLNMNQTTLAASTFPSLHCSQNSFR